MLVLMGETADTQPQQQADTQPRSLIQKAVRGDRELEIRRMNEAQAKVSEHQIAYNSKCS